MLNIPQVKKILPATKKDQTVESVCKIIETVSEMINRKYRYGCGITELSVSNTSWSYKGVDQPNDKATGFFESPDGQNGEFYYALLDVGFSHHFRNAEYHWGVRMGNIIVSYTEGDIDVFEKPSNDYKSPQETF